MKKSNKENKNDNIVVKFNEKFLKKKTAEKTEEELLEEARKKYEDKINKFTNREINSFLADNDINPNHLLSDEDMAKRYYTEYIDKNLQPVFNTKESALAMVDILNNAECSKGRLNYITIEEICVGHTYNYILNLHKSKMTPTRIPNNVEEYSTLLARIFSLDLVKKLENGEIIIDDLYLE